MKDCGGARTPPLLMNPKDLTRQFREAAWRGSADVESFVVVAATMPAPDLQNCLGVLMDRKAVSEGRPHALRCAVFKTVCERGARRELFVPLVRALKAADPVAKGIFVELLPKINSVSGHRELVELFRHPQLEIRQRARDVMAQVGGKTAFSVLHHLCEQSDFPGRIEAIEAMVALAGYHAIPALHATLAVGTTEERLQALDFLGDDRIITKNRSEALEAIAAALDDTVDRVVFGAIDAFSHLATEDDYLRYVSPKLESGDLTVVQAVVRGFKRYCSARTIRLLGEQLRIGPKTVRLTVLDVLEEMGNEEVLPTVAEALEHKQIEVRLRAAKLLENLAQQKKIDIARTLTWLLRSKDTDVKRVAADLAKRIGDPDGTLWPQLLRFLRDEDWWVRERVTDALVEMAGTNLTRHAVGMLDEDSPILRRYAVELLMRLKDPQSLGALVRTAGEDEDWWVAERAVEALGVIGDARAVPYILDFMNREPELRFACVATLAELNDPAAAGPIASLIPDADDELLLPILTALDELNDPQHAEAVMPLTDHLDFELRKRARDLIQRWRVEAEFKDWQTEAAERLSTLDRLLWATAKAGADDLLLGSGRRPYIKKMGETSALVRNEFTDEQVRGLIFPNLSVQQIAQIEVGKDVDFSYEVKAAALRFRVNVFLEHHGLCAVFRIVKNEIPDLQTLGLPELVRSFGDLRNGLVLVGGPTGSGKSTTLAALIDYINRTYARHIITLEDPIEVLHTSKKSQINQRELGTHTADFKGALRSTLREDPDVILVGEMRDLDTISFAISAAETGHLVFGTVHTTSAENTVDRIINSFPYGQQPQVRSILSSSLRAVVCQYLVPRKDGTGRVPSVEIMLNNEAVANLIRQGKTYQIPNVIATARETGMQSMDHELMRLYREGQISSGDGYMRAQNKSEFEAVVAELDGNTSRSERLAGGDGSGRESLLRDSGNFNASAAEVLAAAKLQPGVLDAPTEEVRRAQPGEGRWVSAEAANPGPAEARRSRQSSEAKRGLPPQFGVRPEAAPNSNATEREGRPRSTDPAAMPSNAAIIRRPGKED